MQKVKLMDGPFADTVVETNSPRIHLRVMRPAEGSRLAEGSRIVEYRVERLPANCPKCGAPMDLTASAGGYAPPGFTPEADHWWCRPCTEVVSSDEVPLSFGGFCYEKR